jgi:hypothetical protein
MMGILGHPPDGVLRNEQFPRGRIDGDVADFADDSPSGRWEDDRHGPAEPFAQQSLSPTTNSGVSPSSCVLIAMTTKRVTFCRATKGVMFAWAVSSIRTATVAPW